MYFWAARAGRGGPLADVREGRRRRVVAVPINGFVYLIHWNSSESLECVATGFKQDSSRICCGRIAVGVQRCSRIRLECVRHLGCFWQCVEHGVRERPVDKATTPMMLMFQGDLWKSGWAMTLARDGPVTTRVAYHRYHSR